MHHNPGKGLGTKLVRALVELLFNDPEVTKIQTDLSPSNLRAIRCYEKAGLRGKVPSTPRWSSRVHGSNTPGIRANTQCCLTLPSRTSKGWRPWPPSCQTLNIMREAVIAEVSTNAIEVVGVTSAISNRRCWPYICTAPQDGGLKPHSDIDLLVTVTVRLDETTRRADLTTFWKLRLPRESEIPPRCRSHHCCARRHHSVALSS